MKDYRKACNEAGFYYLGGVAKTKKMRLSYEHNYATYCVYLAPATMAGRSSKGTRINVCPKSEHCKSLCLNASGHNKSDILAHGTRDSIINKARINKTKLFYNDRDKFMDILTHEIEKYRRYARNKGMEFSVRLNGTSDLSLETMRKNGKNILEMFPDVQFYDYTKVYNRIKLMQRYPNYDLTFSFDGYNWDECEQFLMNGGKVAVVFSEETMPKTYKGYKVVDANEYDMRYLDPNGCVMGLGFHPVVRDGKIVYGKDVTDKFVVQIDGNEDVVM